MMIKALTLFSVVLLLISCTPKALYQQYNGYVFGTTFHIVYSGSESLDSIIDAALSDVNSSLSTYQSSSIISRINSNDTSVIVDSFFTKVFNKAQEVSVATEGAFDITVAPLVNAWGFGFSKKGKITAEMVDSLLEFVGYSNVKLIDDKVLKSDSRIMLDASAIAKGFGVDVVAELFNNRGVQNYLVEIGGEVRVKGVNGKGHLWSIAIDKPIDDALVENRQFQDVISFSNRSLASSGNYRNFYIEDDVKYAHTIHPKTGYPAQSDVLSVSVIAPDCMTADAYATAFMVLGMDKSLSIVNQNENLEAYFIRSNSDGELVSQYSRGFEELIKK